MNREQKGLGRSILLIGTVALVLLCGYGVSKWVHQNQDVRPLNPSSTAAENERQTNLVAGSPSRKTIGRPRLPAPPVQPGVSSTRELPATNLITRLIQGEEPPSLTIEQLDSYLVQNRRNAASLLAAFRTTGDTKLLDEALQKFPNDPQVNFAAVFKKAISPEERRKVLDGFKQSAPDNALADYLSALDYFKSGQNDRAVQELNSASAKQQVTDYSLEFVQNAEEAYRAAGYSEAEAKMVALTSLLLPHLPELRDLSRQMLALASSYRRAGDEASAQTVLEMTSNLGERYAGATRDPLLNQLVGMAIERKALEAMDPNSTYGEGAETVKSRLDQIEQQRAAMKQLTQQFDRLQASMSPQDWSSYADRQRLFGEKAALQWMIGKFGQQ